MSSSVHGHAQNGHRSPTYYSWQAMRERCLNPHHKNFNRYGGRGICVCSRWNCFLSFLHDMGERPEGKTLDRIDNDGNYCPENCRWATLNKQMKNRSTTRFLTFHGVTKTILEWGNILNMHPDTIKSRIRRGWDVNKTLTMPVDTRGRKRKKEKLTD